MRKLFRAHVRNRDRIRSVTRKDKLMSEHEKNARRTLHPHRGHTDNPVGMGETRRGTDRNEKKEPRNPQHEIIKDRNRKEHRTPKRRN